MKKISLPVCLFLITSALVLAAEPETSAFPGLQKAMTPEQYEAAGLSKLEPGERAKSDAVDKAGKENKVSAPQVIQSRIVGPFTGYTGRTVFPLENGER